MPARGPDLSEFLRRQALPTRYGEQARQHLLPYVERLLPDIRASRLRVLGINGAQGSGKSTYAALIQWHLCSQFGLNVVQLSLDDFYLPRVDRRQLSHQLHPLFLTRGVPGTHDVALAKATLSALLALQKGEEMAVPRFDKANDDRFAPGHWPMATGPVDMVVFEGWCLGVPPQSAAELCEPVNALEAIEDRDGRWRGAVNDYLADPYQSLFACLDYLLMLKAPDFSCVAGWRLQQERKLAATRAGKALMGETDIARFVQFYERLTRHALVALPTRADGIMTLDGERQVTDVVHRREKHG